MGNLTITTKVLEKYFEFLGRFDNNTKKKLILKLTNSLKLEEPKSFDLASLFGAWKDDRSSKEIIIDIKNSRVEPKDSKELQIIKYLLDTNICIHFFRGDFNLIEKIKIVGIENCAISEITLAELVFGAENSKYPKKNYKLIEAFSEQIAILPILDAILLYGKEKVRLRKIGKMISDFDLLIGTTAIANELIMVTENIKEFNRIAEIKLENWIERY